MSYPPDDHILRDLRISSLWPTPDESRFAAPLVPQVARPDGSMMMGALFAVADLAAASTALSAVDGDWVGTLDLSVRMSDAVRHGPVVIDGAVMRAGGTLVTVRSEVYDGEGSEEARRFVGTTIGSFRRMKRNATFNDSPAQAHEVGVRRSWSREHSGLSAPLAEAIGSRVVSPGVVELGRTPYVTNSFGTINGGTTGMVICDAAESAVEGMVVADVDVRYVGQAREGPVRTATEVLRIGTDHAVVDVMVEDLSQQRQTIAAGSVTLVRPA